MKRCCYVCTEQTEALYTVLSSASYGPKDSGIVVDTAGKGRGKKKKKIKQFKDGKKERGQKESYFSK